jgi:hypothetical protein
VSRDALIFPLPSRRRVAGLPFGAMRSSRRGPGTDLAGSRPYRPGDDVRRIDWRASARLSSTSASDEFIVREHLTEEATQVVIIVDRSPRMAVFQDGFPWLSKPAALAAAGAMIVESALAARCLVGYLDDADRCHPEPAKRAESPFWRPPRGPADAWRIEAQYLPYAGFHASEDFGGLLEQLLSLGRELSPGTFVFLLSDFLVVPGEEVWRRALARGFDLVPVVIQDPTWEQSFPSVAGVVLPLLDPSDGRHGLVRLRRAEVEARRRENEMRLASILDHLSGLALDTVLVSSSDPAWILDAFLSWGEARHHGTRLAR